MIHPSSHHRNERRARRAAICLLVLAGSGCRSATAPPMAAQSAPPQAVLAATYGKSEPTISLAAFRDEGRDDNEAAETELDAGGANEDETDEGLDDPDTGFAELLINPPPEPDQSVTVDSLVATALSVHPSIAAARQRIAAAQNRIPQATALEDPMLGNTFWPIHDQALQTAGGRIGHQFSLTQKVPWPEKLDARGNIAAREVQIATAELSKIEREITESVRLAYYQLWLADELIRIVDDNTELVEDLITVSEARYSTGGSQQDVLRAELEGDRLAQQLITLEQQKEQARADLGALLRQPLRLVPTAVDNIDIDDAAPQLELLVAQAEACNPTLQGLAAEIARDRAKQSLACLQQYPDFQLGLGYSIVNDNNDVISPVANGHDNINFTIGVTLPVWRDKINAGVREASHTRSSSTLRREAERDRLRGTLRRQVAAADAAIEQLSLFRERLIPRTEQTLEIATADYQGKRSDFTDLIDTYRELLSLQVQVARTKATLASTLAQIERIVGCP